MSAIELQVEKKDDEKVLELAKEEKVTEEKIEKSLNYDELTEEEKKAVDDFNKQIDVFDSTQILQYGAAAQNKISSFSDSVLEDVKTKSTGEVGDLLADLVSEIKGFDGDEIVKDGVPRGRKEKNDKKRHFPPTEEGFEFFVIKPGTAPRDPETQISGKKTVVVHKIFNAEKRKDPWHFQEEKDGKHHGAEDQRKRPHFRHDLNPQRHQARRTE